ncbi:MAG: hypothetical protein VB071_08955 [Lawsonibacter sp.]|nr:hypothetical protein [Lawsonibacter sp.]
MEKQKTALAKANEAMQSKANRASFEQVKRLEAERFQKEKELLTFKREDKPCNI